VELEMEKASAHQPVSRVVAFAVAVLFAVVPSAIVLALLPGDRPNWAFVTVAAAFLCGSLLLFYGAWLWYGPTARRLRLAGFALILLAALATLSFAFVLVPLALLAAFSLRRHDRESLRPAA
jgi:hypothetical protein